MSNTNTQATLMNKKFAQVVLAAMQKREESYDKKASDEASADFKAGVSGFIDYNTFYRKSIREASEEAATEAQEPQLGEVVYYLLTYVWNDIEIWAQAQLAQ